MERGTAEAEPGVFETSAGLVPLFGGWEQARSLAESVLNFLVKLGECCGVEVGWNHSHVVRDFAASGAVSEQAGGHLGVLDVGDLIQKLHSFADFPLRVALAESLVSYASTQDLKATFQEDS